jgi:hypothetical protein
MTLVYNTTQVVTRTAHSQPQATIMEGEDLLKLTDLLYKSLVYSITDAIRGRFGHTSRSISLL